MGFLGFALGYEKKNRKCIPTIRHPLYYQVPVGAKILADARLFSTIRRVYIQHAYHKIKAHIAIFTHLQRYSDLASMVLCIDGAAAAEKKEMHQIRETKGIKSLKALRGAFKWPLTNRQNFIEFLQEFNVDSRFCLTEADI
ncbi:hypothetical protein FBU30_010431, partial [Linnemannia zychae]